MIAESSCLWKSEIAVSDFENYQFQVSHFWANVERESLDEVDP
jgi:hypothetical protein